MKKRYLIEALCVGIVLTATGCKKEANIEMVEQSQKVEQAEPTVEPTKSPEPEVTQAPAEVTPEPTTEPTLEPTMEPEVVDIIDSKERVSRDRLVYDWKRAFIIKDTYQLHSMYSDTWKNTMEYDYVTADQFGEEIFKGVPIDSTIRVAGASWINDEEYTIWYDLIESYQTIHRMRQTIHVGEVQGVMRVKSYEQKIYDTIESKQELEEAYLIDGAYTACDYYGSLLDAPMALVQSKAYQDAALAAITEWNLVGGEVTDVKYSNGVTSEENRRAMVTYQFKDGEKVQIPLYRTYNGVWLVVAGMHSFNMDMNDTFVTYKEEQFTEAIDVTGQYFAEISNIDAMYLLYNQDDAKIYGMKENYLVVESEGARRPYQIPWRASNNRKPDIVALDLEQDGQKEITITTHVGTGTGVSIDFFYVLDQQANGLYQLYEYSMEDAAFQAYEHFLYLENKQDNSIEYYMNSTEPVDIIRLSEFLEPGQEFETITWGDFIKYEVTDEIKVSLDLEGLVKGVPMPVFYEGTLMEGLGYNGDGRFYINWADYESARSKKKLSAEERGLVVNQEGKSYQYDLNGDGKEEKILFERVSSEEDEYMTYPQLTINGKVYDAEALGKIGIYMCADSMGEWYLVDLDSTDSYKELAIYDNGPSDDPITFFLRFDGKKLIHCGCVPDNPSNSSFKVNGDKTVNSCLRLGILQTWYTETVFRLNASNQLEEVPRELYHPYVNATWRGGETYLKVNCKFFETMDASSDTVEFSQGEEVYFTATDDKNWVQVRTQDGKVGWFYMEDYQTVKIADADNYYVLDLFSYLCYAD